MAGVSIKFELAALDSLSALLADAYDRSLNLKPLMEQIGEASLVTVEERFDKEQGPDGQAWQKSLKLEGKTLTDEGHLRGSISPEAGDRKVEIGSNLIYARPHQLGYSEGGIVARPYLGIGGDDVETFSELTSDYILGALAS